MPEVRKQASHSATLRVQRGKIRERIRFFQHVIGFRRLRLHAEFVRLPLAGLVARTSVRGG